MASQSRPEERNDRARHLVRYRARHLVRYRARYLSRFRAFNQNERSGFYDQLSSIIYDQRTPVKSALNLSQLAFRQKTIHCRTREYKKIMY